MKTAVTSEADLDRTRAYVRSIAMKYVHNESDADDVTQDAMLLAHRYRDAFRGDSRYSTWLYRVTATAALMFLRKQRRLSREIPASGAGTSVAPGGVGIIGPPGPGTPNGSDAAGDWYLAAVQQKIWVIWTRQVKSGFTQPITVSLTILADGSLADDSVRIAQSSGVQLLDNAALRSVFSAAPFGPFPKTYGTNRITIQALFQPTP